MIEDLYKDKAFFDAYLSTLAACLLSRLWLSIQRERKTWILLWCMMVDTTTLQAFGLFI